jgi:lipid A 3-O-deacylase
MGKAILASVAILVFCAPLIRAENTNQAPNELPNPLRADFDSKPDLSPPKAQGATDGLGNGMTVGTQEVELSVGAGFGLGSVIGHLNHDLSYAAVRYGIMLGGVAGPSHWYSGNWEMLGQLFGGGQFFPRTAYVVGLTPMFRYNLATGTRWSPFIEGGFGPTATDIGRPDLSCIYEFNVQGGAGVQYFWNEHHAVTVESHFFHVSDAGITKPNEGVNSLSFLFGSSWFF